MIVSVTLPPTTTQIATLNAADGPVTIHHPRANSRAGRDQIKRALLLGGASTKIVKTAGWTARLPKPAAEIPVESPSFSAVLMRGNTAEATDLELEH